MIFFWDGVEELIAGRFSVAAYAIVRDNQGRVLLTRRRDSDDWVLPGGSVEEAEAPWEALVREVAEETGLEVEVDRLLGVYAKRDERDLVLLFAASRHGGDLGPSDERDRVEFVDPGGLPRQTSKHDRERIADALEWSSGPILRVQPSNGGEPSGGIR